MLTRATIIIKDFKICYKRAHNQNEIIQCPNIWFVLYEYTNTQIHQRSLGFDIETNHKQHEQDFQQQIKQHIVKYAFVVHLLIKIQCCNHHTCNNGDELVGNTVSNNDIDFFLLLLRFIKKRT